MSLVFIVQNIDDTISVPLIFIEVFLLMLSSFLIGYFFAFYAQKNKYLKKIAKLSTSSESLEATDSYALSDAESDNSNEIIPVKVEAEVTKKTRVNKLKAGELDFDRIGSANPDEADDLQKIIGIGPYTEEKLNTIGIYTFGQISRFNNADIELITERIQFFPDRIKNDNWVGKAKMLNESKRRSQLRREGSRMKRA